MTCPGVICMGTRVASSAPKKPNRQHKHPAAALRAMASVAVSRTKSFPSTWSQTRSWRESWPKPEDSTRAERLFGRLPTVLAANDLRRVGSPDGLGRVPRIYHQARARHDSFIVVDCVVSHDHHAVILLYIV